MHPIIEQSWICEGQVAYAALPTLLVTTMIPQSSEPERRCVDPIASQSSLLSSDDASTSDFSEVSNSSAYEGDLERRLSGTTVRQLLRIK